jgi:hypothetical protein
MDVMRERRVGVEGRMEIECGLKRAEGEGDLTLIVKLALCGMWMRKIP